MIRSALVLTAGLFVSSLSIAEETIGFPAQHLCTDIETVKNSIKEYKEVLFAKGHGMVRSGKDGENYPANILVYLSENGSFTITAEMDTGIHCILTSGINFKPSFPTESSY